MNNAVEAAASLIRRANFVLMIRLYSYELAYLINNSGKQTIFLEMEDWGFATK